MFLWLEIVKLIYKELRDFLCEKLLCEAVYKPWMKWREIVIIEEILDNLKPQKCLEWGAGYSTLYFPKLLDNNAKWVSIEHEKEWFERIKNLNKNDNVELYLVEPNRYPWSDIYGDGDYLDLKNYVEFPSRFGKFDFILIDGRARKYCLEKAYELLKNSGVVVLHDANRVYYHEPFRLFKHSLLLTDYRKDAGGIWIGSKGLKIEKIVDINKHVSVWKIIKRVGKLLRI